MKNGLFTTTPCEKTHGASEMRLHNRHQKQKFIKRRLCWVLDGISKVLFILSCSRGTKPSIRMSNVLTLHHSIIIYSVHFKTIWMEKHSIQMRLSKMSWFSFLPLRTKLSAKAELWSWMKDGKRASNKMVNTQLISVCYLY